jgi:hypothetical protein
MLEKQNEHGKSKDKTDSSTKQSDVKAGDDPEHPAEE